MLLPAGLGGRKGLRCRSPAGSRMLPRKQIMRAKYESDWRSQGGGRVQGRCGAEVSLERICLYSRSVGFPGLAKVGTRCMRLECNGNCLGMHQRTENWGAHRWLPVAHSSHPLGAHPLFGEAVKIDSKEDLGRS